MERSQGKRVLVVDDEEDVVFFLSTALQDAGFQVETALSVDEALEKIRANPPDCISLDMVMPGKSGVVLFHELHKNPLWSKIPVLFLTGHAREEKVRRDLDAAASLAESTMSGPTTYLDKPVTAAKFVKAVAATLRVDLPEAGSTPPNSERDELQELIKSADPEALREALRVLKSRPRQG
ncbi:MAG: response regulator [Acidobacteriota bacterium]